MIDTHLSRKYLIPLQITLLIVKKDFPKFPNSNLTYHSALMNWNMGYFNKSLEYLGNIEEVARAAQEIQEVRAGGLPKGVGACGKTPPMEVCRRSAEGCVGACGKTPPMEVCQKSARGLPEVCQVREHGRSPTTTTNARREVLFTHCGLKVHSHYSV